MSMVSMQRFSKDAGSTSSSDEHYMYVFGGIKVVNETYMNEKIKGGFDVNMKSSYEFVNDMWRYDLVED